jgi:hypothetical protein
MIKLTDILQELSTTKKDILGQGFEHNVYPSKDPNKVIKVGETKYVKKWVEEFKSRPDLFPIIYKTGLDKDDPSIMYVVMERLDTEQFEVDFDVLDSILEDGILDIIKRAERSEDYFNKIVDQVKQQDEEIADFFIKLYNNVVETKQFRSGLFSVYDFHKGQFGYDKKGNIKCLDL